MPELIEWTTELLREWIVGPKPEDDKYSRGVLGVVTGSDRYPGAAVIGVEAASRTGLGMLRYLGSERAASFVLQRRPEVVTADGRVQAWLLGSGMDADALTTHEGSLIDAALRSSEPVAADAGALRRVTAGGLHRGSGTGAGADDAWRVVVTPHARELLTMLSGLGVTADLEAVLADPSRFAGQVAERLGVVVLLKGTITHVLAPDGTGITVTGGPAWLATAGTGDALGGVLGALLATNASRIAADHRVLAPIAASAALLHALAGQAAAKDGPLVALDVAEAVRGVVAELLRD
ncbi:ADP-dependent NAD(P)H-hydrate dehydratase [Plantibacter sp. YIM 135347]|uniref:ADP-dependent NAD(P)H-hydrate dehydratase n=1 Tax=Plantibacter sp. YIM 135347 TaxID=3423919 RepID=UPI003D32BE4C